MTKTLPLLLLLAVPQATAAVTIAACVVPETYSENHLRLLVELNCGRVANACAQYQLAIDDGGDLNLLHESLWRNAMTEASRACGRASRLLSDGDPRGAAFYAINAWGTSMMDGKECCTMTAPPFCVDTAWSASILAVIVPNVVLILLFAASVKKGCKPNRRQELKVGRGASRDALPAAHEEEGRSSAEQPRAPTRHAAEAPARKHALRAELRELFMKKSCLRVLHDAVDFAESSAHLFSCLADSFGFQADSVRNQFEHLLSLWRSECSMVADVSVGARERVQEATLLQEALRSLHGDMLDSFCQWRAQLARHAPARMHGRSLADVPESAATGGPSPDRAPAGDPGGPSPDRAPAGDPELPSMLAEIVMFLLVWGEAGNVRFMPEALYFITELALAAGDDEELALAADGQRLQHAGGPAADPGDFLARVIRPIYHVVFEEWYDEVGVDEKSGRDKKVLREGFDNFLPADVANYDDWNELFCDPQRLVDGIVLQDGTRLFDLDHHRRFAALSRVDWRASLAAKDTKTHREVHSLWAVFASTQRIWLVHAVLLFCTVCAVARNPPEPADGGQSLGGRTELVRFAAVGLIVPGHALVWIMARWQVTGSAMRRKRAGRGRGFRVLIRFSWVLPIATYVLARARDGGLGGLGALIAHYVVSALALVKSLKRSGSPQYNLWRLSPRRWRKCFVRYSFWAVVLALKFTLGMVVVRAVDDALSDLNIVKPGRLSLSEISQVCLSTGAISDFMVWSVLASATVLFFVSDTGLWFTFACTFLGAAIVLVQRGCRVCTYAFEDALAKIPERFSRQVLPYTSKKAQSYLEDVDKEPFSPYFPLVWDRIVEHLRYDDKIDSHQMGGMSFTTHVVGRFMGSEYLRQPLRLPSRDEDLPLSAHRSVKMPDLFRSKSPLEIGVKHYLCIGDSHWPTNADARWRLVTMARGLGLPMPRPFRAPYIPGITVLIPHYGEPILLRKRDLLPDSSGGTVPLINWVRHRYREDFANFSDRMQDKDKMSTVPSGWPTALAEWDDYTDAQWDTVGTWASMRMQTLWRTVAGMCLYHPALQLHYEAQKDESSRLARPGIWDPSDCFTCLVSMQMYKHFDATMLEHTNKMFQKLPGSLQVAFIDHDAAGPSADIDNVHPRQRRRYYSCLIDRQCPADSEGRKAPRYRIELPGYPVLGDGKGDNQNHAIPFMRGIFSQCIDANQGAYFEQMLLLPNALGEFRRHRRTGGLAKRIVGFPEHITSDFGSVGDFAASSELAFGTVLQRTYAVLGGRMHYGHPDIMNKLAMMQQGGVSKATKTLNLSEDIFAGMDLTLRGGGRSIRHREYFHLAKGRDLGFNTVLGFFSKLSSGTGEQILTRQVFRLGQAMHLPEALTFYYGHGGYYFTQYLVSLGMPVLAFTWLVVLVSDCEASFSELQSCSGGAAGSSASVMASLLGTMFSWMLLLFLIAGSLPIFFEMWMERSLRMSVERLAKQVCTLSPLMYVFLSKVIGYYVINEIRYGGATYVATGRGLPTERRPLVGEVVEQGLRLKNVGGLYLDYASIAMYDGAMLLVAALLVIVAGWGQWSETNSIPFVWFSLGLTIVSWLLAPFIFNPYQFNAGHYAKDVRALLAFFLEDKGRHWTEWFDKTQLRLKSKANKSLVDIGIYMQVLCLMTFFQVLNSKGQALAHVYPEYSYVPQTRRLMFWPPVVLSGAYCLLAAAVEGCYAVPLPASAALVAVLGCGESVLALWPLAAVGWSKGFIAGLLIKWAWLLSLIRLAEWPLRRRRGQGCFQRALRVLELWIYAHRMARDILTSSLIVLALLPLVLLNSINELLCPGCGAHQLLIYRDPGHMARKEARVRHIDPSRAGESGTISAVMHTLGSHILGTLGLGSSSSGPSVDTTPRDDQPLKMDSPGGTDLNFGMEPKTDESCIVHDESGPNHGVAPVVFGSPIPDGTVTRL